MTSVLKFGWLLRSDVIARALQCRVRAKLPRGVAPCRIAAASRDRWRGSIRALALWVVLGSLLMARSIHAADSSIDVPLIAYEMYTLPNGLSVVLAHDGHLPLVAVNVTYRVGVLQEPTGMFGLAELIEHAMFTGSAHVAAGELRARLQSAGAVGLSAATGLDHTSYFETLPSNYLEMALWLESDRMGSLSSALSADTLERQRRLIEGERQLQQATAPCSVLEEQAARMLYPPRTEFPRRRAGASHGLADARDFVARYYVPANATLVIAGDFDPLWVKAAISKYFGSLPARPAPVEPRAAGPQVARARRVVRGLTTSLPVLVWQWRSAGALTRADAVAHVLAEILGGGKASRLYRTLVYEQPLAQAVAAHQHSLRTRSVFSIEAVARPGVSIATLRRKLSESLRAVREGGVTAAEVASARARIRTELVSSLQTLGSVAKRLQLYAHYARDPGALSRDLTRYDAVRAQEVQRLANQLLRPNGRISVYAEAGAAH